MLVRQRHYHISHVVPFPADSRDTAVRANSAISQQLRLHASLVDQFLASYVSPPKLIVLDFDDTEDPVHGEQEQARYDGYYGGYCFLPLHLYEGLSGRLITTIFKAKRFTGTQMLSVLTRLVKRLRHAWPDTLLIFRGDRHFAYADCIPAGKPFAGTAVRQGTGAGTPNGYSVAAVHPAKRNDYPWRVLECERCIASRKYRLSSPATRQPHRDGRVAMELG